MFVKCLIVRRWQEDSAGCFQIYFQDAPKMHNHPNFTKLFILNWIKILVYICRIVDSRTAF